MSKVMPTLPSIVQLNKHHAVEVNLILLRCLTTMDAGGVSHHELLDRITTEDFCKLCTNLLQDAREHEDIRGILIQAEEDEYLARIKDIRDYNHNQGH